MKETQLGVWENIEQVRETRSPVLHLELSHRAPSDEQLTKFPLEILDFTWLRELRVIRHAFNEIPNEISNLTHLNVLQIESRSLTKVPEGIGKLTDLRELRLWGAGQQPARATPPSDLLVPETLKNLRKLQELALVGWGLRSVPEWISDLSELKKLNLSSNQITTIPTSILRLQKLDTLWLHQNLFETFPELVTQLSNLQALSISNNRIASVPSTIGALKNLTLLWLFGNDLDELPESIGTLPNLKGLNCSDNDLHTLPDNFGDLKKLVSLSLDGNRFSEVPGFIYNLPNLKELSLRGSATLPRDSASGSRSNTIRDFSVEFLRLESLERLYIDIDVLETPPPEIAKEGIPAIREYFRQLDTQGTDYLYEAKLLIIGEGGAGKTTLRKKILDPEYNLRFDEISTEGIDVVKWEFPLPNGRNFRVNIWDFGGQEIYHATHQFFLTKRSLYILVADARKEDTDFYYWLSVVELLSNNSPLLIISNQKQGRRRDINDRFLRSQYPNLKEVLSTDLATTSNFASVLSEVRHHITNLSHVGSSLPKNWVAVREALEKDNRNYISSEELSTICWRCGIRNYTDQLQLSGYLHDIGVCLHFHDDAILKKTVILKPSWGTRAVYAVLDDPTVIAQSGHFTRSDLQRVWDRPEYDRMSDELLRLMMNFRLCYELPDSSGTYIAPQRLPESQPDYTWVRRENIIIRYQYEFMPKGILTSLIVVLHHWIMGNRLVWKTGVVFHKNDTQAEVLEHYGTRELRVSVVGKHKKELLAIVMHELEKIHASYKRLKFSQLIPCNCLLCSSDPSPHFFDFQVLRRFAEDGQVLIQCQKSYEMVNVMALIDDVSGRRQLTTVASDLETRVSSTVTIQGDVKQLVLQHAGSTQNTLTDTPPGEHIVSKHQLKPRTSAWANGLFYLFAFLCVIAALGVAANTISAYVLPIILIAAVIFVPLIGVLQLRMDRNVSEKSFVELVRTVMSHLPLVGAARRKSAPPRK
jgi:internalin A